MVDPACSQCNAALHPGDLFCGNCGAPTVAPAITRTVAPTPATTTNPIAVAQMPTVPPPVGVVPVIDVADRPRRSRSRLVAGVAVVVAVASIAGLGLALLSTRDDLDNERAKLAQIEAATASTTAPDAGAIEPVFPAIDTQVQALQQQIDDLNAALLQAQKDLATEREGRTADAAAQTQAVADLQAQLTQLQALFPVTQAAIASADPTGQFTVALTPGECTLADCTPLPSLNVSFTGPAAVTGDRVNGTASVDGGDLVVSGTVDPASGPLCAGQPADPSYRFAVHVTSVDAGAGVLRAIRLQGTYTETIGTGTCAGQHRTYAVDLTRA